MKAGTSSSLVYLRHEWKNSVCSLTRGSLCSNSNRKTGETEYGIGWLPLGGYVKIAGMIDESMDTEQMKQPMQPWELLCQPGMAASADYDRRRTVQFPVGIVHLLHDTLCVGR